MHNSDMPTGSSSSAQTAMQDLMDTEFEAARIPDGWILETANHRLTADGFHVGQHTRINIPVPGPRWRCLELELVIEQADAAVVECSDHTVALRVDLGRGEHCATIYGGAILARCKIPVADGQERHTLRFRFCEGKLTATVDGRDVLTATDPQGASTSGLLRIAFWGDCRVRQVCLRSNRPEAATSSISPVASREDLRLEVAVDFFDDLRYGPFTADMFDQLFREFKEWGVRRCHWIYYGGTREGWWRYAPSGVDRNAALTVAAVGEIFPAAVAAAHAHDIELYGLIKPFDMGFARSMGEGAAGTQERAKMGRIGGPVGWIADFAATHRDLCMSRKPGAHGPARNPIFTRIDLVKEDDQPSALSCRNVRIYVSDDNTTYRPYSGPMSFEEVVEDYPVWAHTSNGGLATGGTRRARVLRFKGLDIQTPYLALATDGRDGSFANTPINLIHVYGPEGEERLFTLGVKPRMLHARTRGASTVDAGSDFRVGGIEFDTPPGIPSAVRPGYNPMDTPHALDSLDGVLAIARGKERTPVAALSPSFPATRTWWLQWVQDCLMAGADGIELRVRNHHSPFTWAEFGFEKPVVEAFRKRHGIDLLAADDFDVAAWRRLRGEAYTQFYRDAAQLVRGHGKRLGLHVSQTMCLEPEFAAAMDIHWDWRTWIDEGLADSITLKEVWPGTRFGRDVLEHARAQGVPAVFCPYANNIWTAPGAETIVADRIRLAREWGCQGFQYYECASVIHANPDGHIEMTQPDLRNVFRDAFSSGSVKKFMKTTPPTSHAR